MEARLALRKRCSRVLRLFAENFFVGSAYFSVAMLVKWSFSHTQFWPAPFWFPAGVAMFAVFSYGGRCAPGIFLGSLLTNTITFGEPVAWSAVISCGNTAAPILAVWLVRGRMRVEDPFSRVVDVFFFYLSAIVHGMISGFIGCTAVWVKLSLPINLWPARWLGWTISDAGASLLLVPLLLLLQHKRGSLCHITRHWIELLLTCGILTSTVFYLLSQNTGPFAADAGASYLILLPLLWLSIRFSSSIAYPMFVAVMVNLFVATLSGVGPYAGPQRFFALGEMVIGFGAAVLLIGAASAEQYAAKNALYRLNQELESRVEQRTAELQQSKLELEKVAFYDVLTGLPNRRLLESRFGACRAAAARTGTAVAFLLIDLDYFKETNDNLGHDAGDAVLIETGRRLSSLLREYDVLARLGGDEFAVLLPGIVDRTSIDSVCDRIIRSLAEPVFFNGSKIPTSASMGAALSPDHGDCLNLVYKAADLALYRAKRRGRCRWEWHHADEVVTASD